MNFINRISWLIFLCLVQISCTSTRINAEDRSSWKNIYTVGWRDAVKGSQANAHANLQKKIRYARHMGYDSIAFGCADIVSYIQSYSDKSNLKFYIVDPHLLWEHFAGIVPGYVIDEATSYTQAQKDWYTLNMVNKSTDAFPNNLAPSYYFGTSKRYSVTWDFQQQRVIDMVVEKIVDVVKSLEDRSINFTFGGYIVDVARLRGAFAYWNGTKNVPIYLDYWTGTNSGVIHGTITHEYPIVDDGMAAYYKTLNNRLSAEFGEQVKWITMPSHIYSASGNQNIDEWLYEVEQRPDYAELQPDLYLVENHLLSAFLTEPNIFDSIIPITKDMVGSAHNTQAAEDTNRSLAANIGINGAWYHWAPRFGGGDIPDFQSITEVWPRLKLIRCIPNWDNLNNVPLSDRSWNNTTGVYQSTKSYISSDVMYSRHPNTGKLFAVFNTTNEVIRLNTGETVTSMQKVDGYFIESGDASADFNITGSEIRLKSTVPIEVDSGTGQVEGKGYIFTLSSGTKPTGSISINSGAAYTKSTTVTLNLSATDSVGVTGYYLSSTATPPSATAGGWITVPSITNYSASVLYTLSSGNGSKTVYAWYKDSSGNVSTTASDSITLDTTAPVVTITTPTSSSTYTTASSTISLGGNASDSTSGVSTVSWSSNRGGSGTASGTTTWSISSIALSSGSNVITVTVTDRANNTGTDTITVTNTGNSTAPTGSISINSGAAYTKSTTVTLNLSATDSVGVTGYYLSTTATPPSATAGGWITVPSTTNYSASVLYTLSSGNGSKTVYAWYKDSSGNVSATASDSITLDTTAPVVTITTPTSSSTYTTTSSTMSLGGSASDGGSGVSNVMWSNSRGGSGTASGTTSWSISGMNLSSGDNIITVTATDGANNTKSDAITVTRNFSESSDGLQTFYRFDEGSGSIANDSSGNGNNGTVYGATWTTGRNAGALSFNGTNSYVSLSDSLPSLTEFTCTAWVKVADLAATRGIFTSGGMNDNGFRFRVDKDGSVLLLMAGGGKYDALSTAAGVIKSGVFYHISVSGKSGQYMRIYVNGTLVKEKTTTQAVDAPTDAGYIGTSWNTNRELMKGTIDDIRIYNRTLSGQEILNLYNNDDLQVFYKFDEGIGSIANDSSGNGNNGAVHGATWATGRNAGALSFNGTNSYVSLSDSLPSLTEFTCTAWVKVADLAATRGIFTSGGMNDNGFRFRVDKDGSVLLLMAGGGKYDALSTAAGVIKSGVFYHISVSGKSGQYMRIYVNGTLVKEKTTTQTVDTPAAPGYIGTSWSTRSELMNGTIDDVRIYNRTLSDTEIQDLYNQYSFFVLSFMKGG